MKSKRRQKSSEREPTLAAPSVLASPIAHVAFSVRSTVTVLVVTLLFVVIAYAGTWHGEFVYDDHRQIVQNPLIQEPALLGKALGTDVWAFANATADESANVSNYWRPLFVGTLAMQYAMFGTSPGPWHGVSIALHFLACVLAFFVLRRLGARLGVCAASTWIFAATPLHVESVAWISGSPDPATASLLFLAFLAHMAGRSRWPWRVAALCAFAGALMEKEIAIVFPLIVFFSELVQPALSPRRWRAAIWAALPFAGVAAVNLCLRVGVIGMQHVLAPGAPDMLTVIATAPSLAVFYAQHLLWPFGLGPTYPVAPVAASAITFSTLGLPLILFALLTAAVVMACRFDALCRALLPWLILPLLPVFDIRSFLTEDIAHDRYLYLPSFAAITMLVSVLAQLVRRRRAPAGHSIEYGTAAVGLAIAVAMLPLTWAYAAAWATDTALWERAVEINPNVAIPHAQLGDAYRRAQRLSDARRELERALVLHPNLTAAQLSLAGVAREEHHYDEAIALATPIYVQFPNLNAALEVIGMSYQAQGRVQEAIAVYEHGRRTTPYQRGLYTVNLAVLQRQLGHVDQARKELESLGPDLQGTRDPKVMIAWWYLGELDREAGRKHEALSQYDRYLAATASMTTPDIVDMRQMVLKQRQSLQAQ
jgi:tetratricopeptide (TPR) repeat protein